VPVPTALPADQAGHVIVSRIAVESPDQRATRRAGRPVQQATADVLALGQVDARAVLAVTGRWSRLAAAGFGAPVITRGRVALGNYKR